MNEALARMCAAITRQFGLVFDEHRAAGLTEVMQRRAHAMGVPPERWLAELEGETLGAEHLSALAVELTVTETSFFRHREVLRAFSEVAVPEIAGRGPLRVLSAGCSSGEEPATLAILLRELGRQAVVHAFDLNPRMLERARLGRYREWSLRELPPETRARWFRAERDEWVLDPAIREQIRFEQRNLAHDDGWAAGSWDIVFCRNVLMYLEHGLQQQIVARFARALVPGGFLFLGHAETLRGLSDDFQLRQGLGAFWYQRLGGTPARARPSPALPVMNQIYPPSPPDTGWLEAIGSASERIRTLSAVSRTAPRPAPLDTSRARTWIAEGQYALAGAELADAPHDPEHAPEILLLRAVVEANAGEAAEAERLCRALLAVAPQHAGAHYLLALCRERESDPAGALAHARCAAQLDPSFAMPWLHVGLLARKDGDLVAARHALAQALLLLQREDPARIALFGGGFGREMLLSLCRGELRAAGGGP